MGGPPSAPGRSSPAAVAFNCCRSILQQVQCHNNGAQPWNTSWFQLVTDNGDMDRLGMHIYCHSPMHTSRSGGGPQVTRYGSSSITQKYGILETVFAIRRPPVSIQSPQDQRLGMNHTSISLDDGNITLSLDSIKQLPVGSAPERPSVHNGCLNASGQTFENWDHGVEPSIPACHAVLLHIYPYSYDMASP